MTTISFANKAANNLLKQNQIRDFLKNDPIPLVQELADQIRKINLPEQATEIHITRGPLDRIHACFDPQGELVSFDLYKPNAWSSFSSVWEEEWRSQKPAIYVLSERSGCASKTTTAFLYLLWRVKNPPHYSFSSHSRWISEMKAAALHTLQDCRRMHVVDTRRLPN